MAKERLSMRKIREILRLKYDCNLTDRQIVINLPIYLTSGDRLRSLEVYFLRQISPGHTFLDSEKL